MTESSSRRLVIIECTFCGERLAMAEEAQAQSVMVLLQELPKHRGHHMSTTSTVWSPGGYCQRMDDLKAGYVLFDHVLHRQRRVKFG